MSYFAVYPPVDTIWVPVNCIQVERVRWVELDLGCIWESTAVHQITATGGTPMKSPIDLPKFPWELSQVFLPQTCLVNPVRGRLNAKYHDINLAFGRPARQVLG